MNQAVMLINCYLYGATVVMLLVLLLIAYLRGQVNHFPKRILRIGSQRKQEESCLARN